jgi:hypothetical protein
VFLRRPRADFPTLLSLLTTYRNNRDQVVTVERDDGTVSERLQFVGEEVSADFFKAIGTPLLRGRFFSIWDAPVAPPVAMMARRRWPGHDADLRWLA